ncbi:MAG: PASTA domain-containing protein [Oscillospiraceae bacterium]|jgi:stage V sporulation protein D (sporulation-specific penicillin-binding protein)|nr:PASTA domain-containing protein [Oscillospiraceae bacterium]
MASKKTGRAGQWAASLKKKRGDNVRRKNLMRAYFVLALLAVGAVVIALHLSTSSIKNAAALRQHAENNQLLDTVLRPQRGNIYDANMELLAQSANVKAVVCWPSKFLAIEDEDERAAIMTAIADALAPLVDKKPETVLAQLKKTKNSSLSIRVQAEKPMSDAVSLYLFGRKKTSTEEGVAAASYLYTTKDATGAKVKDKFYAASVVGLDPDTKRYYPKGTFASSLLGFTGRDDVGLYGLEQQFNKELTGIPGRKLTAQNAAGGDMASDYDNYTDPIDGNSLVLTLDATIQRYLERELAQAQKDTKANATSGIVMDVQSGAVLAMAGTPSYDLNRPMEVSDEQVRKALEKINTAEAKKKDTDTKLTEAERKEKALTDAQNNMQKNHAITDIYYPGSVFKCLTAAMALEEKVWGLGDHYYDTGSLQLGGRTYHCHKRTGHGDQDFTHALMNSCNTYFITVGQKIGVQKFSDYFEAFGLTEQTGFSTFAETKPKAGVTYHAGKTMSVVDLASSSFGQSFQVTPLQMLTAISAIANGGKLMTPYIVDRELDAQGNTVKKNEPTMRRQVVSADTAAKVTEMMRQVVVDGTGKNGYVPGYRVAGKTGTSQKMVTSEHDGKYVASFVCFAPADNPKIACIITIDEPGNGQINGSVLAAPVAERVMEDSLIYLNVVPQYSDTQKIGSTYSEKEMYYDEVPKVVGKDIKEAQELVKKNLLTARVIGEGDKIVSQVPAAGEHLYKDGVVLLYTTKEAREKNTTAPDFMHMTPDEAKAAAASAGLHLLVKSDLPSLVDGVRVVPRAYRQSLAPGKSFPQGSTVTVTFKKYSSETEYTGTFVE